MSLCFIRLKILSNPKGLSKVASFFGLAPAFPFPFLSLTPVSTCEVEMTSLRMIAVAGRRMLGCELYTTMWRI